MGSAPGSGTAQVGARQGGRGGWCRQVLVDGDVQPLDVEAVLPRAVVPDTLPVQSAHVSAATLHPRRSEVNSGQCNPVQPDSAHFRRFTYGSIPKILPEQFLYINHKPDAILVSVAAERVTFR